MRRFNRSSRGRGRDRNEGGEGFVLIEAIVAFAVLAIGLGALITGITVARRSDARIHARHALERVAQSRLEAAGRTSELKIGRRDGRAGRVIWTEIVTSVDLGGRSQAGTPAAGPPVRPMWVEVVVRDDGGRELRLAALKLAPDLVR